MKVIRHESTNYRNLCGGEIFPSDGLNVVYGENGQGKTNFIESIWLFTGCLSFRTRRSAELVSRDSRGAGVSLDFYARGREQEAYLQIGEKRKAQLNGVWQESPRKLLGEFFAVVFSPSVLSIVQDGPAEKRKFLDIAISQTRPTYAASLSKYMRVLANRNALLKQMSLGFEDADKLAPWDEELSKLGGKIMSIRREYVDRLSVVSSEIYSGISGGREKMRLRYISGCESDAANEYELAEAIFYMLQSKRTNDIRRQYTSVGPHRDDIVISVKDMQARSFASQGQQRTCALSMKLGEAVLIKEITGEQPVALLDDVMSELDAGRQKLLMKYLEDWQVFITCCDPSHLLRLNSGKAFEVKDGAITEIKREK